MEAKWNRDARAEEARPTTYSTLPWRGSRRDSGRDLRGVSRHVPQYMCTRGNRGCCSGWDRRRRSSPGQGITSSGMDRLLDVSTRFRLAWEDQLEDAGVDCKAEGIMRRRGKLRAERLRRDASTVMHCKCCKVNICLQCWEMYHTVDRIEDKFNDILASKWYYGSVC